MSLHLLLADKFSLPCTFLSSLLFDVNPIKPWSSAFSAYSCPGGQIPYLRWKDTSERCWYSPLKCLTRTVFMCIFDHATRIQLISLHPPLSIGFARSCSFVVCLSLFSSLAWTNIFVRILFWVSLHVSTFPLPWSETAGEMGGKRESESEQINCIISAYKLNPWHKCSSGSGAFCRERWEMQFTGSRRKKGEIQ